MELETDEENSNWSYWAMEVWGKAVSKITDSLHTASAISEELQASRALSLSLSCFASS